MPIALDQIYDVLEDSSARIQTTTPTGEIKQAQSFKPSITAPISRISIKLKRESSPVGNIWMTIEADSGGSPSGIPLATSQNIVASSVGLVLAYFDFDFNTPYTLVAETTYWYVLQGDWAQSDVNTIKTYGSTALGYTRGVAKTYNGSVWSAVLPIDFNFKEYYLLVLRGAGFIHNII